MIGNLSIITDNPMCQRCAIKVKVLHKRISPDKDEYWEVAKI